MSRRIFSLMVAVALVAFGASFAVGATVFDNGEPDGYSSWNITKRYFISADDFLLTQSTTITGVHFWAWGNDTPSIFSWSVYGNSYKNGIDQPGDLVDKGSALNIVVTQNGYAPNGDTKYTISFDLDKSLTLNGSTKYWLALQSSFTPETSTLQWETTVTGNATLAVFSSDGSSYNWTSTSIFPTSHHNLAFQLTGSPVPIPGAVWLFGSGLVGLVGLGRKRFKK